MNGARMWFVFGFALLCAAGCSDSANTDKPKEIVDPLAKFDEPEFLSLKRQAEAGDAAAQNALGLRYSEGKGVAKDPAQALVWWRKAADQGEANAQYRLGEIYNGTYSDILYGVPKDAAQAVTWYRKAAEQGYAAAQRRLGVSYLNGEGIPNSMQNPFLVSEENKVIGVGWLRKAAERGDAGAQFILGGHLNEGKIGPDGWQTAPDPSAVAEAVKWYRKAADQGLPGAQLQLGMMYTQGEGVPKDASQAAVWFRKAAEQGNAAAQRILGWMYEQGEGVPKDDAQAVAWWRKAAEQGEPDAQNNLGAKYDHGEGVPRDAIRAYMWFNLAAAQGNELAGKNRDIVSRRMSPEQIAEAQRLTREWKPGQHTESSSSTGGTSGGAMEKALTGTAFVVSSQGHLLTNRHVVGNCQQVRLAGSDKPLRVLPQDEANDLALLQMTDKPKAVAVFRATNDLRQGEDIAAYGYPLLGALAAGGNLSPGVVSALAGLGNNTSQIQITAPVQQGNSGGPVLDGKGQVVGVVVQKLNAVKVAKLTGDVPQNVNFAINESTTRAFLDSNQVGYKTGNWWNVWQKDLTEIAEDARDYTVVVECWK